MTHVSAVNETACQRHEITLRSISRRRVDDIAVVLPSTPCRVHTRNRSIRRKWEGNASCLSYQGLVFSELDVISCLRPSSVPTVAFHRSDPRRVTIEHNLSCTGGRTALPDTLDIIQMAIRVHGS